MFTRYLSILRPDRTATRTRLAWKSFQYMLLDQVWTRSMACDLSAGGCSGAGVVGVRGNATELLVSCRLLLLTRCGES